MQSVQQAHWLNQHPEQHAFFFEARQASRVSRRDFVRMLGAAGFITAAGGFVPLTTRAKETRPPTASHRDPVAILGAGLAGLTAAYRLHQAGIPCEIFEGSERIGGRVLTKYDFNKEAMFCELGGELVDSNHQDLITLARDLGVDIQELKGVDRGADLYFFGGKHYADEQLIPLFQPFARKLAADLEGIYDKDQNLTAKAQRFDKISLAHYLAESSKGVENWVIDLLHVAYTIEYGRDADEQSALNLIVYLKPETSNGFKIFGDSDESKRIKGGSSSLPSALVKALTGIDPDRLPEEKAREITIELGFAQLILDGPNEQRFHIGIVDVPGHEDFVRNMLAGVGSADIALLTIAADDGWMPQTEEHFQILEVYAAATAYYLILTSVWDAVQRRLEKHFSRSSNAKSARAAARVQVPQASLEARA